MKIWSSGVPKGSVLGPLLFLIHINDAPDEINSLCKIFADDTSLFSKVYDIHKSASKLNDDLERQGIGLISRKCSLIQIPTNRLMKLFYLKKQVQITYHIHLSNLTIMTFLNVPHQKYLGIVLDSKLNSNVHVDQKIKKCNRIIGLVRLLSITLPWNALLTIYQSFVRPHFNYGDISHDKPNHENFQNKLEIFRTN